MGRGVRPQRMTNVRRLVVAGSLVLVAGCASLTPTASPSPLGAPAQATSLPSFPGGWVQLPSSETAAQLTVEVEGLQDMKGLDLVGGLDLSMPEASS